LREEAEVNLTKVKESLLAELHPARRSFVDFSAPIFSISSHISSSEFAFLMESFTVAIYYTAHKNRRRLSQADMCDDYGVSTGEFRRLFNEFNRLCGSATATSRKRGRKEKEEKEEEGASNKAKKRKKPLKSNESEDESTNDSE
jgi:hypothetical protein